MKCSSKGKFQVLAVLKQDLQKPGKCFPVIKKCVQDNYIDQNFSVNLYKNLFHSSDIDIMAKCGIDNKNWDP